MTTLRSLGVLLVVLLVLTTGAAANSGGADAARITGTDFTPTDPVRPSESAYSPASPPTAPDENASSGHNVTVRPVGHGGHAPEGTPICIGPDTAFGTLVAEYVANERATNGTGHLGANLSSFVISWTSEDGSVHHALVTRCEDTEGGNDTGDETDEDTNDDTGEETNTDEDTTDEDTDDTNDGGDDTTDDTTDDDTTDSGDDTTDDTTDSGDDTTDDTTDSGDDDTTDDDTNTGSNTGGGDPNANTGNDAAPTGNSGSETDDSGSETDDGTNTDDGAGDGTDDGSETTLIVGPTGGTIPTTDFPVPQDDGTADGEQNDEELVDEPTDSEDESDSGIPVGQTGDGGDSQTDLADSAVSGPSLGQSLMILLLLLIAAVVARQGVKLFLRTG